MSKEKTVSSSGGLLHFMRLGLYKRNQGRITRQASFATLGVTILLGSWRLYYALSAHYDSSIAYSVALITLLLGLFVTYRVVNLPRFADFLISVEAEMNKVSWPSRGELIRSAIVVIVVIFFLAGTLFVYDLVWGSLFKAFGISPS